MLPGFHGIHEAGLRLMGLLITFLLRGFRNIVYQRFGHSTPVQAGNTVERIQRRRGSGIADVDNFC
ncbi:hypothetical protein HCH_05064 [Hahella chejuensis KCTC 2396]|uniref:Uncharacterized protein n=1 Tax=Hahella chejuensis (strain KCTC 2396) TaxID=349521 RepID=Q2SC76_HAHCH|nr:hypothetical protein HCH_05064 [Hahella chejuensis KCTC 2396]